MNNEVTIIVSLISVVVFFVSLVGIGYIKFKINR
jgi:hypothetical protein